MILHLPLPVTGGVQRYAGPDPAMRDPDGSLHVSSSENGGALRVSAISKMPLKIGLLEPVFRGVFIGFHTAGFANGGLFPQVPRGSPPGLSPTG